MKTITNLIYRVGQSPLLTKAFHTFWQAFLAVWLFSGFKLDKATLVAAAAAGLSAVKTFALAYLQGRRA